MNARKKTIRRIITWGALVATCVVVRPGMASDFGVRAGYYFDSEAVSFGMEMLSPLDGNGEWYFNPNLEVAMGDNRDFAALNGDFHYDFDTQSNTAVWVGAGPSLLIIDQDQFPDDDTDVDPALNLLLGVGAKTGQYRPFIQGKGVLSDNSEVGLAVGLRF